MGNEIILFETKDHAVTLQVPVENETVWLTANQMAQRSMRRMSKSWKKAGWKEIDGHYYCPSMEKSSIVCTYCACEEMRPDQK